MSIVARGIAVLVLFLIVAVVAPEAAKPIVNSADLIVWSSPVLFLALVRPRRHQTPAGGTASPTAQTAPTVTPPAGTSR